MTPTPDEERLRERLTRYGSLNTDDSRLALDIIAAERERAEKAAARVAELEKLRDVILPQIAAIRKTCDELEAENARLEAELATLRPQEPLDPYGPMPGSEDEGNLSPQESPQ